MYAYCLFCETRRCDAIAEQLEKRGASKAFSPKIISRQRKQGKTYNRLYDFLPGYVFVYLTQPLASFDFFSGITGIIRCLGNEQGVYYLESADYDFAMYLYKKEGIVGAFPIIKEGDQVHVLDPLFQDYRGTILDIDHRKKRAKIQFHFDSKDWTIWAACDVLYKDNFVDPFLSHNEVKQ